MLAHFIYWLLGVLGGEGFSNRAFSYRLLAKHFVWQKVFRINANVPWPVHISSIVTYPENIRKGTRCPGLSPSCYIQGKNGIEFGDNVWIGPGVGVISANHELTDFTKHIKNGPIHIGNNCWLGMNSVILPGVELGEHVIVAAGAVVTRDFPDNCVIGGNPQSLSRKSMRTQGRG